MLPLNYARNVNRGYRDMELDVDGLASAVARSGYDRRR
jgi:hypothetical protein